VQDLWAVNQAAVTLHEWSQSCIVCWPWYQQKQPVSHVQT
jgi:hypothetical protein